MVLPFSPSLNSLLICRRLSPILFKIYQLFSLSVFTNHFSASVTQRCSISIFRFFFPFSVWSFFHFLVSAYRAILGRKISYLQVYFVLQDAEKPRMYWQNLENILWVNLIFLTKCDTYQEDFE